jgi:hypothetical protein
MTMPRKLDRLFAASTIAAILGIVTCCLTGARAAIIVDTFDAGDTFHPQFNNGAAEALHSFTDLSNRLAVRFQVPAGPSYALDSITVPINQSLNGVSQDLLRFRLAADIGGGAGPGATIETLSQNQPWPAISNPFTTTTTLNSAIHPTLTGGAYYWMVTELTSFPSGSGSSYSATFRWYTSVAGPSSATDFEQSAVAGTLPADPWPTSLNSAAVAYRVDGTVPEPASTALLALGAGALALRLRRARPTSS